MCQFRGFRLYRVLGVRDRDSGCRVYAGYRVEVDTPTRHSVVGVTRIGVSSRQYGHLFNSKV